MRTQKNRWPRCRNRCGYGRHNLYQFFQPLRRCPPQNAALQHAARIALKMSACNAQALLIAELGKTESEIGQCNVTPTAEQYE